MSTFFVALLLFVNQNIQIQGKLVTSPHDQHVRKGNTTNFNCSSDLKSSSFEWKHAYIGFGIPYDVFRNGTLQNGYAASGRFSVDSSNGQSNLFIRNVQMDDAGEYICIESGVNGDRGEEARAHMQVQDGLNDLVVVPDDSIVVASKDVRLACSSSYSQQVWWKHQPVGSPLENEVYLGIIGFRNGYHSGGRHSIIREQRGQYDLLIKDVHIEDAGTYYCIDKNGIGRIAKAELVVLGAVPMCSSTAATDGVLAENCCGLDPDQVTMSCNVNYKGNMAPEVEWKNNNTTQSIQKQSPNSVVATLTVFASTKINFEGYVCQVGLKEKMAYNCKLNKIFVKTINVPYRSLYKTDRLEQVNCTFATTETCTFLWVRENQPQDTITSGRTLNLTSFGKYMCNATCRVRETNCIVNPMMVEYFESSVIIDNRAWIGFAIVCALLIIITVITILITKTTRVLAIKRKNIFRSNMSNMLQSGGIQSLSMSHDCIYLIRKNDNIAYVYGNESPFSLRSTIQFDDGIIPEDIAVCEKHNCLYISDSSNSCIWKVYKNIGEDRYKTKKFAPDIESPYRLSVTSTGNIAIVHEKKDSNPSYFRIVDGSETNEDKIIKLNSSDKSMKDMLVTPSDQFLVSFGNRIGLVNKSGYITNAYPKADEPPLDMKLPPKLFCGRYDNIFMINQNNGALFLFDKQLVLKKNLKNLDLPKKKKVPTATLR